MAELTCPPGPASWPHAACRSPFGAAHSRISPSDRFEHSRIRSAIAPTGGSHLFFSWKTTGKSGSQLPPYGMKSKRMRAGNEGVFGTRSKRIPSLSSPFPCSITCDRRAAAARTWPVLAGYPCAGVLPGEDHGGRYRTQRRGRHKRMTAFPSACPRAAPSVDRDRWRFYGADMFRRITSSARTFSPWRRGERSLCSKAAAPCSPFMRRRS